MKKGGLRNVGFGLLLGLSLVNLGCDEEKAPEPVKKVEKAPDTQPEPEVKSPPHFVISEDGASVRSTTVEGAKKTGIIETTQFDELKNALNEEKEFILGKEVHVVVDRKAKRGWVAAYLTELDKLGATKFTILTETRAEFTGQLPFSPPSTAASLDKCTMIGQVTTHNGSALWQLKGGSAKERGPGLGGPDLTMAMEVFEKTYEKCDSDAFVTDGEDTKDWGFIYDMAAAAVSTPKAGITRALLLSQTQTPGRPVKF